MSEPARIAIPLAHYPGMNRFVLDWVTEKGEARRFLARQQMPSRGEIGVSAAQRPALAAALDVSNRRWGIFAKEQLRMWADGRAITLIAGQQVGFAGGPLYTLAKLATLVKMRRELEASGVPATAFFWLATEDHDFDEVAQLSLPISTIRRNGANRQLDLLSIRATRSYESKNVVGRLPVPEALITELLALYDLPRPSWLRDGVTFGDSFAELIASIFGSEVILVDSLLPELRRAGSELFKRIGSQWHPVQDVLRRRSSDLKAAGYAPPIEPREDGQYTLFFDIHEGGDRRIIEGPREFEPERTSTSALTRPLLQDAVLQPDIFIGGPAEVAYYAQLEPLHELLGIRMPRVALRGHVLLAPKRVVRFVERFAIRPDELFDSPDELLARREPAAALAVEKLKEEGQRELMSRIEKIAQLALPADHALSRAINRSIGHIEYHFAKLAERAIRGIVRKDRERWAAVRELSATLHPDGKVQDRIVGWFPFWCQHEQHFIDRMISEITPDADSFKVISI